MTILKCKMCGGDIQATDSTYGTCDFCGSTMTLPKASDERIANLFNRANHFRRQNEFDKAMQAYENILNEDNSNAEAYWGVVLSRYGIEYVEDPISNERIPTCHRAQFGSVLSDADYLAAIERAPDNYSRSLYEQEAKRIADIQYGILATSQREESYDVFICYKETSTAGTRTKDSMLAQEVYYQLANEGYTVFFSRITLEDKLGQHYEPYIFAALHSARVMVVIGTSAENFNAVWVRNEWARYLALMKQDRSKLLIPCYRDMDAYDLPKELSIFQSQDMRKIGFMQDLVRGIKKVVDVGKTAEAPVSSVDTEIKTAVPGIDSLIKRGHLFIEDGDWKQADDYFDRVLDIDPEYAPAYIGKLLVKLKASSETELSNCNIPLSSMPDYKKALRFANLEYRRKLEKYEQDASQKAEEIRRQKEEEQRRLEEIERQLREQRKLEEKARCESLLTNTRNKVKRVLLYEASCKEHCQSEQFQEMYECLTDAIDALEEIGQIIVEAQGLRDQCKKKVEFFNQQKRWADADLCVHCGGKLSLFSSKCFVCGARNILS